jgi:hypothetical protein
LESSSVTIDPELVVITSIPVAIAFTALSLSSMPLAGLMFEDLAGSEIHSWDSTPLAVTIPSAARDTASLGSSEPSEEDAAGGDDIEERLRGTKTPPGELR